MSVGRWLPLLLVVLFSGLFAYFNAGERTTLNLGFTVLYRVSMVRLVLGSFILGMIAMFLVGLRQDLQLRRRLRAQGLLDREAPRGPVQEEPRSQDWGAPVSTPPASQLD
jgi:uncharacterized integral membrane protein